MSTWNCQWGRGRGRSLSRGKGKGKGRGRGREKTSERKEYCRDRDRDRDREDKSTIQNERCSETNSQEKQGDEIQDETVEIKFSSRQRSVQFESSDSLRMTGTCRCCILASSTVSAATSTCNKQYRIMQESAQFSR